MPFYPHSMPEKGELQLTDILGNYHLHIDGQKMSKSTGNFYTGDQLINEMNFDSDQIRYFLAILSLAEKNSNFDFETFKKRNAFLAGPLNAAFEKPISAAHKKFGGKVPEGKLIGKTKKETYKIVQNYIRMMDKGDYPKILFAIENYSYFYIDTRNNFFSNSSFAIWDLFLKPKTINDMKEKCNNEFFHRSENKKNACKKGVTKAKEYYDSIKDLRTVYVIDDFTKQCNDATENEDLVHACRKGAQFYYEMLLSEGLKVVETIKDWQKRVKEDAIVEDNISRNTRYYEDDEDEDEDEDSEYEQ